MAQLSEWLQLMLAEIARKQEEEQRALEEQRARELPAGEQVAGEQVARVSSQAPIAQQPAQSG